MENKLKSAFEEMKMDDGCQARIREELKHTKPFTHRMMKTAALLAACMALLFIIFTNAEAVEALETMAEKVQQVISNRLSQYIPGGKIEEEYVFEGGAHYVESGKLPNGNNYGTGYYITGSKPSWLSPEEDGLYFTGNGQRIQVDKLITEETPFTYVFTDSSGIIHHIAVGVTDEKWQGGWDGIGWAEWFQNAEKAKAGPLLGWISGYATGQCDPETGEDFLWLQNAKQILGVPFP